MARLEGSACSLPTKHMSDCQQRTLPRGQLDPEKSPLPDSAHLDTSPPLIPKTGEPNIFGPGSNKTTPLLQVQLKPGPQSCYRLFPRRSHPHFCVFRPKLNQRIYKLLHHDGYGMVVWAVGVSASPLLEVVADVHSEVVLIHLQ